jgi:5-methylcytosine-specific restriction endonuclease McrA
VANDEVNGRNGSTWHWRKLRAIVFARDGHVCQLCGGYATTIDHVVPIVEGGARHDPANLRPLCAHCNYSRGARLANKRRPDRRRRWNRRPGRRVWVGAIDPEE